MTFRNWLSVLALSAFTYAFLPGEVNVAAFEDAGKRQPAISDTPPSPFERLWEALRAAQPEITAASLFGRDNMQNQAMPEKMFRRDFPRREF